MSLPMEWKMINDAKFSLNNFMFKKKKKIFKVISKKKKIYHFIIQIMCFIYVRAYTKAKNLVCVL